MVDCVLKKGSAHKVMPQDYALAETLYFDNKPYPFICVADGCSSGRRTEVGAQILCNAAFATFKDFLSYPPTRNNFPIDKTYKEAVMFRALKAIDALSLTLDDMLATLKVAFIVQGKLITMDLGDGYSFFNTAKKIEYDEYEYSSNAPFYLGYILFGEQEAYKQSFYNSKLKRRHLEITQEQGERVVEDENFPPETHFMHVTEEIDDMIYFGISSDGLGTYIQTLTDLSKQLSKPVSELMKELFSINTSEGAFIQRRFNRMDKQFLKDGFENYDDIGIAFIDIYNYRKAWQV